jgi:hypothetical protein
LTQSLTLPCSTWRALRFTSPWLHKACSGFTHRSKRGGRRRRYASRARVASGFRRAHRYCLIHLSVLRKKGAAPLCGPAPKKADHWGLGDECSRPFLRMRLTDEGHGRGCCVLCRSIVARAVHRAHLRQRPARCEVPRTIVFLHERWCARKWGSRRVSAAAGRAAVSARGPSSIGHAD